MARPRQPDRFPGFGRPLTAPAPGVVAAAHDREPDHDAFRGLPSVSYALTQHRRAAQGWTGLGGNHVVIALGSDVFVALCHLRKGSVRVAVGQSVTVGDEVGECGNSGNSTEPHVHVQAMDGLDLRRAGAVPLTFADTLPHNREIVDVA